MKMLIICLITLSLYAGVYKAKVQPYETITLSSEVSGKIVFLNQADELKSLNKKVIVIDHKLESLQLQNTKEKLNILNELISIKQNQYNRIKNLKGQSLTVKQRYKSELLNLKLQEKELENAVVRLQDTISKKEISLKNLYLKKLYVNKGSFVVPGAKLMDVENQSASRVVIYVDVHDRKNIQNKKILIDGKSDHGYRIEKAANSTDERYLSSYRVELVKKGGDMFGKIVTVEVGKVQ